MKKIIVVLVLLLSSCALAMQEPAGQMLLQEKLNEELFQAVAKSDINKIKQLLNDGASACSKKQDWYKFSPSLHTIFFGQNAMHCAALLGNTEVAELLIDSESSDLNGGDDNNIRPMHCAALQDNPQMVKLLILLCSVTVMDDLGNTPLHYAASNAANAEIIRLLISAGADVNGENQEGYTPLRYAIDCDRDLLAKEQSIRALLSHGAEVTQEDIDCAIVKELQDIAQLLVTSYK
jgi:ankyrin repeat protein